MENKKIIIIDDDEGVGQYLCYILGEPLKKDGYEVIYERSSKNAIEYIKNNYIALVITDMQMPEVDGLDIIREVKNIDRNIPVVVISGNGTVNNTVKALKMGACNYLTKPCKKDEIMSTVRKSLRVSKSIREYAEAYAVDIKETIEFSFPSKKEYSKSVIKQVIELANSAGYSKVAWCVQLAIEEAISNAIEHGNKNDISKSVYIKCSFNAEQLELIVKDEGEGYNEDVSVSNEPDEFGRGIFLIKSFMDEVEFNERGNIIRMIKFRPVLIENEVRNVL